MLDLQSRWQSELIQKIYDLKEAIVTAIVDLESGEYDSSIEVLNSELDKLQPN